jgi:hypothetical protein
MVSFQVAFEPGGHCWKFTAVIVRLSTGTLTAPLRLECPSLCAAASARRAAAPNQAQQAFRPVHAAAAAGAADLPGSSGTASSASSSKAPPQGFTNLELMIANQLGGGPGGDWKEMEGCWVLRPPNDAAPKCLVHFIGGSFVGAAPQLAYRPLLEALAARGALVSLPRWLEAAMPTESVVWLASVDARPRPAQHATPRPCPGANVLLYCAGRGGTVRHQLRPPARVRRGALQV